MIKSQIKLGSSIKSHLKPGSSIESHLSVKSYPLKIIIKTQFKLGLSIKSHQSKNINQKPLIKSHLPKIIIESHL